MKRIFKELKPYTFSIIITLLLSVGIVVSTLMIPVFLGEAVDTLIGPARVDTRSLLAVLYKMGAAIIATVICQLFMNLNNNRIVYSLTKKIRPELFGGLILIGIGVKVLLQHLFQL